MSKNYVNKNTGRDTYQLPQPSIAKYLVVVTSRGMTSGINHFDTLEEAKRAFAGVARSHRYKPSEINSSDYYHVSIWKWIGNKYEDINYYP